MFISNMERSAKKQSSVADTGVVSAVYTYENMKDWIDTSKAMLDLKNIKSIDTKSLGGGKVNFDLHYTGSLEDLYNALPEIGLSYKKNWRENRSFYSCDSLAPLSKSRVEFFFCN